MASRPPKPVSQQVNRKTTTVDGFDKAAWIREAKTLSKECLLEERARFGPLGKHKSSVVQECEKVE